MQNSKPTRDERTFSRKFVRAVRRHYRRKLKRQLHKLQGARLASYKSVIRQNVHAILVEERLQRGRTSPIVTMSRKRYDLIAKHIVDTALAPESDPLAYSHHPTPGEVEHHNYSNVALRFLCACGATKLANRISDHLTFVPDQNKISTPYLRLNLEQEFESELDARKEELQEYGYRKLVKVG